MHEKQKALEAEVVSLKMKCEAQKKVLAEEQNSLQATKEETKNVEALLSIAQSRITSLTEVKEGLKQQASLLDKENNSDKLVDTF